MRILLLTSHAQNSCRQLIEALGAEGHHVQQINPFKEAYNPAQWDSVFSYGCSYSRDGDKKRVNSGDAVARCVSKVETFKTLARAGLPIPAWTTDNDKVPHTWKYVVCRRDDVGRKAEGYLCCRWEDMDFYQTHLCKFFTEYFPHRNEYRVVVFKGEVVGIYHKTKKADGWQHLMYQNPANYPEISDACTAAAKALRIDYVGFDVVASRKSTFRILEANSGTILTEEASAAIGAYYRK